jgi:hypothetical protein
MVDNAKAVNALFQEDRKITVTDIANKLDISCGFTYSIMHEDLGYHKICARWVPKQLTDEKKWVCMELLQCYHEEGEAFPQWIVTGNETWVHHYEPVTKYQAWSGNTHHCPGQRNSKVYLLLAK